jgi:hypothetical protein
MLVHAAWEQRMVAIVGLILHAVGIVLMLRYRLPDNLPRLGIVFRTLTSKELAEDERRRAIGMIGLVCFVVGTLLLIVSFARAPMF